MRSLWSRQIALSETETLRAQDQDRDQDIQARDRDETETSFETGLETRPGLETSITGRSLPPPSHDTRGERRAQIWEGSSKQSRKKK